MEEKPQTEVIRRVWTEGYCVEVGEYEIPDFLELRVPNFSIEHFGSISLVMTPDYAEQLGNALLLCAQEKRASKKMAA
jgi:hypothetical protein